MNHWMEINSDEININRFYDTRRGEHKRAKMNDFYKFLFDI